MKPKLALRPTFESSLLLNIKFVLLLCMALILSACGHLISNAKQEFSADLSATILAFDDLETIKKAVPSYLLLISSLIRGEPDNPDLLESGAQLYTSYGASFTDSAESKKALTKRAHGYASRAMCLRNEKFCSVSQLSFAEYESALASVEKSQVESLFIFTSSWASVIEANSDNWNAVAELPKVKAGVSRVLVLDETVNNGNAHVFMAVLESLLPPGLGGKPEIAKHHFERANELSNGKNLMAKVLYAEKYARMVFDRELHDSLLQEVIDADLASNDHALKDQQLEKMQREANKDDDKLILINMLAKQKAAALLNDADDYF